MAKTSVLISSLAAVVVVGGVAYWVLSEDEARVPIPTPDSQNNNPNAIANQWQWENFTDTKPAPEPTAEGENAEADKPRPMGEVPYDVVQIYNILQSIQIDDYGRVVPDQTAKNALEKAFDDLGPDLSSESMAELQELIRIGLPGEAGEEAARILEGYYQYRLAEEEFNQQLEEQLKLNPQMAQQSPPSDQYEKLVELRRRFLGEEIADKLFAVDDVQARHMVAAMAIQQNADLTDEEKQLKLNALQEDLNDRLLTLGELDPEEAAEAEVRRLRESGASSADIYSAREAILGPVKAQELAAADHEEEQWQRRFNGFWQARQQVMQAALDPAERERQIEQLLAQYYSPDELDRARLTLLEWESRERQLK